MTRRKQGQRVLWEGMIDEDVRAFWEPWMVQGDRLLDDEELIDRVYEAQGERHEHSATRGRSQTPAEMVLRLLLLKHVRNWSFDVLEREVRMNLAYRDFARIGMGKVPDAKTLGRQPRAEHFAQPSATRITRARSASAKLHELSIRRPFTSTSAKPAAG